MSVHLSMKNVTLTNPQCFNSFIAKMWLQNYGDPMETTSIDVFKNVKDGKIE